MIRHRDTNIESHCAQLSRIQWFHRNDSDSQVIFHCEAHGVSLDKMHEDFREYDAHFPILGTIHHCISKKLQLVNRLWLPYTIQIVRKCRDFPES